METVATGTLFGAVVSVLLAVLGQVQPVQMMQRWGTDAAQRLHERVARAQPPSPDEGALRFSFLNLAYQGCAALATADACADPAAPPAAVIGELLARVAGEAPLLIVLDFPLGADTTAAVTRHLAKLGASWSTVPVLAPLEVRPLGRVRHVLEVEPLPLQTKDGPYRASYAVWSDPSGGNVVRGYPATDWLRKIGSPQLRLVPGAPLAVALLLDDPSGEDFSCLFTGSRAETCELRRGPSPAKASLFAGQGASLDALLADYNNGRLRFTLPNFIPTGDADPGAADQETQDRYDTLLRVFEVADLVDPSSGQLWVPPGQFTGTIVVVGNAGDEAGDFHLTPLGVLQGWQLLVNAIRAYWLYPPATDIAQSSIATDLASVAITAVVLLVVELGRERLVHAFASRRRRRRTRLQQAAWKVLSAATFVATLVAAACISIFMQLMIVALAVDRPGTFSEVDILVPTLAVLLGAWAEGAERLLGAIRQFVAWVVDAIAAIGRWGRAIRSPGAVDGD